MPPLRDLTGRTFGRWKVLRRAENGIGNTTMWLCECECGITRAVASMSLLSGDSHSCGCLKRERQPEISRTHGGSKTPLYRTYHAIIKRCYDSNDQAYHNYGGRGITMCDRWLESFEAFRADVGERPEGRYPSGYPIYTLDRIDNDGNYEPSNVRWATVGEQQENRRYRIRSLRPDEIEALADGLMSPDAMAEFRRRISAIIRQPR